MPVPIYQRLRDVITHHPERLRDPDFTQHITKSTPFDIAPVYTWLTLEKTGQSTAQLFVELDVCLPPYPYCVFEYPCPSGDPEADNWIDRTAVLTYVERMTPDTRAQLDASLEGLYDPPRRWRFRGIPLTATETATFDDAQVEDETGDLLTPTDDDYETMFDVPDDGWLVYSRVIMHKPYEGIVFLRDAAGLLALDADGRILRNDRYLAYGPVMGHTIENETREERDAARTFMSESIYTALFACSLLHCKNVTTTDNTLSRQQQRLRQRQKLDPIEWKTLVVAPHTARPAQVTHGSDDSRGVRQHMVRGHFAEYGPDYGKGKLFGKYSGRYWIPPMVRGSDNEGLIVKEYNVRAAPSRAEHEQWKKDSFAIHYGREGTLKDIKP